MKHCRLTDAGWYTRELNRSGAKTKCYAKVEKAYKNRNSRMARITVETTRAKHIAPIAIAMTVEIVRKRRMDAM